MAGSNPSLVYERASFRQSVLSNCWKRCGRYRNRMWYCGAGIRGIKLPNHT